MKDFGGPLPSFRATSELTTVEISATREFLAGRTPFCLYFNAALADLKKGLDNRSFHLSLPQGLVMAIDFDGLRIFSVIGEVDEQIITRIAKNPLRSEFHVASNVAEKIKRTSSDRVVREETLRYYRMKGITRFQDDFSDLRRLTKADLPEVQRFYHENYKATIFSSWMLELPFFGCFENGELLATGGTVVLDFEDRAANLGNFLTAPRARGKGLAKKVTRRLINELLIEGYDTFTLGTTEENIAAWKVYESVGFTLLESRVELELKGF